MKQSRSLFLAVLVFLSFVTARLSAQWVALPNAASSASQLANNYYGCASPGSGVFNILPYGDDKIVFTSYCQGTTPMSGTDFWVAHSFDNLVTSNTVYFEYGSLGCCFMWNLVSYDDTTFSYFHVSQYGLQHFYTTNAFNTVKTTSQSVSYATAVGNVITPHFFYILGKQNAMNLIRIPRNGTACTTVAVSGYTLVSDQLKFMNDSVGFILAYSNSNPNRSVLIRTEDWGTSWTQVLTDSVDEIVDYQVIPSGVAYALKRGGAVYKSTDGGLTFIPLSPAATGTYNCLHFANSQAGFIGGENGVLLKTADGGTTWSNETSNTTKRINAIYTYNYSSYFVDADLKVFRSDQPLGIHEVTGENHLLNIFPNPANNLLAIQYNSNREKALSLFDITGKELRKTTFNNSCQLDVSEFSSGIYFVKIFDNKEMLAAKKLVISK